MVHIHGFSRHLDAVEEEFDASLLSRGSLEADLDRNNNLGTPISWLPDELLIVIFLISSHFPCTPSSKKMIRPEVIVSHVSRHWRSVALSTPLLWSTIRRKKNQKDINHISVYLHRSQPAPFDLFASFGSRESQCWRETGPLSESESDPGGLSTDAGTCISPFCEAIKPHFARCQKLRLSMRGYSSASIPMCILTCFPAPRLKCLYISIDYKEKNLTPQLHIFKNNNAPLSRLSLVHTAGLKLLPPLQMVTHFRFDIPGRLSQNPSTFRAVQEAFKEMISLDHLELHKVCRWPDLSSTPPIMPTTRTITIYSNDWHDAARFIDALNAPSLQEMTLRCRSWKGGQEIASQSFYPLLHTLRLGGYTPPHFPSSTLLDLARITPQITTLHLIDADTVSPQDDLDKLFHSGYANLRETIWPCMRVLGISGICLDADLSHLLTARAREGCAIQKVLLSRRTIETLQKLPDLKGPPVAIEELKEVEEIDW